ncbi:kinase-like protein [Daldinia loculata]|uniref:kinase-like protein n=1 Tax=Daldinia loculata TaxID=103429 RepID=UPI0020C23A48|nr:kinase-like protein [Daldinia loculata]KAI1648905.1 kinase-like protein [Daldinia loculata]
MAKVYNGQSAKDHASEHKDCVDRGNRLRQKFRKSQEGATTDSKISEGLREELWNSRIETDKNGTYFIPFDKLELARNRRYVEQSLRDDEASQAEVSEWSKRICPNHPDKCENSFIRIFAILVLCEKPKCIGRFLDQHVDDSYLPLHRVERKKDRITVVQEYRNCKLSEEKLNSLFQDRRDWRQGNLDNFATYQWWVLAPFFGRPDNIIPHYILESSDVLPITEKKRLSDDEESLDPDVQNVVFRGGFSDVFIVKLHPSHYNFQNEPYSDSSHWFALKRLKSSSHSDFKLEVDALRKYNYGINKHLMPLLATIQKEDEAGKYYLLFPKANGDLRFFWRTQFNMPSDRIGIVRWMAEQCLGIANALSMLHKDQDPHKEEDYPIYGRHGDIKAANILWFSKPGTKEFSGWRLALSDFGLMRFHRAVSISAQTASKIKKTLTYQAPEFDITGAKISRKSDIWALGCTYLEFITCYISGYEAVQEDFPSRRGETDKKFPTFNEDKFYRTTAGGTSAELKPSVKLWIHELRGNPRCSSYLHDFLTLIERDMLCIELDKRRTAIDVARNLERLSKKCQKDSYLMDKHIPRGKKRQ